MKHFYEKMQRRKTPRILQMLGADVMPDGIGDKFHNETKYQKGKIPRRPLDFSVKPPVHKSYEESRKISLPKPETSKGPPLWRILTRRRSVRSFSGEAMQLEQLSQLLWASQGITKTRVPAYGEMIGLRTAPSAGALYPIETYVVVTDVASLDPGIYHYDVLTGDLELVQQGEFGMNLVAAAGGQTMLEKGNVVFVWTAVFARSRWKYRQRAYRYVFLDAGHIAQNLALAAEGLNLGTCQVGAFFDDEVNQLLGIDGKSESTLYLSVVGCKKK